MEDILHTTELIGLKGRQFWKCTCGAVWSVGDEKRHPNTINRVEVVLFKPSGKYYTTEFWEIPSRVRDTRDSGEEYTRPVIGPYDMLQSPDFRRIGGGSVLVSSQEPWGYPALFPSEPVL